MKLYEISEQYTSLLHLLEQEDTEEEVIRDTLESIQEVGTDKLESIYRVIRNLDAEIKVLKMEEERLKNLRKKKETSLEWLKEYAFNHMQTLNLPKVETPIGSFSIRKAPVSIEISDISQLPDEWKKVEVIEKPDKTAIKNHLIENHFQGKIPEGEFEFEGFKVINNKQTLSIK